MSEQTRVKIEGQLYTPQQLADKLGVKLGKGVTAKLIASRMQRGVGYTKAVTQPKVSHREASRMGARASGWYKFRI